MAIHKIVGPDGMVIWTGDEGYKEYCESLDKEVGRLLNQVVDDIIEKPTGLSILLKGLEDIKYKGKTGV